MNVGFPFFAFVVEEGRSGEAEPGVPQGSAGRGRVVPASSRGPHPPAFLPASLVGIWV